MKMHLTYIGLELKRASKQLPNLIFGAAMLAVLLGMVALLCGRMLYGERAAGRIEVGVVLPEEDALAKKAVEMISSLNSVETACNFHYLSQEEAEEGLEHGELYALLEVPEGFVEDIMDGINTPVKVVFSKGAGIESQLFRELTDAGARTLGAAQAGIYAGDDLLKKYGLESRTAELEVDLNRAFLAYSLPRSDYFRDYKVSATGDVSTMVFYGISAFVLYLLLTVIPVSGYLTPQNVAMRRQLKRVGIGSVTRTAARILGTGLLLVTAAVLAAVLAVVLSAVPAIPAATGAELVGMAVLSGGPVCILMRIAVLVGVCLGAAAFAVCLYQLAGNLMGGIMLLFLVVSAQHFLAGGFLPSVFLPKAVQELSAWMPSAILMDAVKCVVTDSMDGLVIGKLILLIGVGTCLAVLAEGRER